VADFRKILIKFNDYLMFAVYNAAVYYYFSNTN